MNIPYLSQTGIAARFYAVIMIVSLLLSAVPVAFFVAEASTSVDLELSALANPSGDDALGETVVISNLSSQDIDLTGWSLVDKNGDETVLSGTLSASSDMYACSNMTFATNGGVNCDFEFGASFTLVNNNGKVALVAPSNDEIVTLEWVSSTEGQYVNAVGSLDDVLETTGGDSVSLCHSTGNDNNPFNPVSPNLNSFFGGHSEDTEDIIPSFFYDNDDIVEFFPGNNWDDDGIALFKSGCGPQPQIETGTIKIVKEYGSQPEGIALDFKFYIFDDNGDHILPGGKWLGDTDDWTEVIDIADGPFKVQELVSPGWVQDGIVCTSNLDADAVIDHAAITLTEDETVTCVFTNSEIPSGPTQSADTVVITGDTSAGENQPGWLFNRDLSNATPIEFNTDESSIGNGSLNVLPLSSTPAHKFIGEFFTGQKIADTHSVSYDFKIGSGGDVSDDGEFYMNVYANFGESASNKYYDCKYDVIPTTGSVTGFTTVTFDPTQAYPVTKGTQAWNSPTPYDCPVIPADMDDDSAGSFIRMFALNMGDTSTGDVALDGYFDKVVNVVQTGDNVHTRTFDFEPLPATGQISGKKVEFETNNTGLAGWTIVLYDANNDPLATTTTGVDDSFTTSYDETGDYSFQGLEDGFYYICEVMQDDWLQKAPTFGQVCPGGSLAQEVTITDGVKTGPTWFVNEYVGPTCDDDAALNYGASADCEYPDEPVEACEIEGHKYNQLGVPLSGWLIGLEKVATDGDNTNIYDLLWDTTDDDGYFCLEWDNVVWELRGEDNIEGDYDSFTYRVYEKLTEAQIEEGWENMSVWVGDDFENLEEVPEEDVEDDGEYVSVQVGIYDEKTGNYVIPGNSSYHVDFYNEEIDGRNYCGNGVIDQEWEQCDGQDVEDGEQCTDYCTLDNQCSSLQLVKITVDQEAAGASESFDGTLHLGVAGNVIPNGVWFPFDVAGDDDFVTIGNAVEGLAIQRDTDNDKLVVAFVGGNSGGKIDFVQGTIMTMGIDLGGIDRTPNPTFKLEPEDGNSGFPDLFEKDANEGIDFDLRADTGPDAVTVEIGQGPEYDCDECKAEVEARVVLQDDTQIINGGEGNLLPQVILGDGSTVVFGEWFPISLAPNPGESAVWIDDAETASNFPNEADLEGLFVSREGDGTVNVALSGFHSPGGDINFESLRATIEFNDASVLGGSTDDLPGIFKIETHTNSDGVDSNDGFDSFDEADDLKSVDFDFWVDTAGDGIVITLDDSSVAVCDEDTNPDRTLIDGFKFEVIDGEEESSPKAGWTIYAYNDETEELLSTTTNEAGYYYFWVEDGYWEITEEERDDWELVKVEQSGYFDYDYDYDEGDDYHDDYVMTSCEFEVYHYDDKYRPALVIPSGILGLTQRGDDFREIPVKVFEQEYSCTFYNEYTEPEEEDDEDGHSESTRTNRFARSGQVLGAATSQCGMYLYDYMQEGQPNSDYEVTKLQFFLNGQGYFIPVTGVFDEATDGAVHAFQTSFQGDILTPWQEAGYVPHNHSTGWVYQLTRWKINNIVCPGSEPLPVLIP